jgi:hypothetical protein
MRRAPTRNDSVHFHLRKLDLANVLKEMALFCVVRKSGR